MKKILVSILIASQLFSSTAFAFPTAQELRTNRVQLERLRRYIIFQFGKNPQSHTQESVNQVLQVVTAMDVQIVRLVFMEVHRDDMAAEQEAADQAKAKEARK